MRISLLIFASLGLISSAAVIAETPSAAASPPAGAAALNKVATWKPRTLKNFGGTSVVSCELLVGDLRALLLQLGARASDLHIDDRGCTSHNITRDDIVVFRSVDATFSVLAPANKSAAEARGDMVEARWQTVEMGPGEAGDTGLRSCAYLKYVTQKVLPLFSRRHVKLISKAVCDKTDVGLRAQVLVPLQPLADTR
jgi:hypothetical protein